MRILVAFLFMLMVNIMLAFSQVATSSIAAEEGVIAPKYANYDNSFIESYQKAGADNYTLDTSYTSKMPQSITSVQTGVASDLISLKVFLDWLTSAPKFIWAFLTAVPNFLVMMGLPPIVSFMLGIMWHALTLFLIILTVVK